MNTTTSQKPTTSIQPEHEPQSAGQACFLATAKHYGHAAMDWGKMESHIRKSYEMGAAAAIAWEMKRRGSGMPEGGDLVNTFYLAYHSCTHAMEEYRVSAGVKAVKSAMLAALPGQDNLVVNARLLQDAEARASKAESACAAMRDAISREIAWWDRDGYACPAKCGTCHYCGLHAALSELGTLRLKWESDEPGKPGHMHRGLCRYIVELTGAQGSSKPPRQLLQEFVEGLKAESQQWWERCQENLAGVVSLRAELASAKSRAVDDARRIAELESERARWQDIAIPICIGPPIISILAERGEWTSERGSAVIAADGLFRKDPYKEIATLQAALAKSVPREVADGLVKAWESLEGIPEGFSIYRHLMYQFPAMAGHIPVQNWLRNINDAISAYRAATASTETNTP